MVDLLIWLGIQSILIFIDGRVHEWMTSNEEKIINNWWLKGIIKLLSVSTIKKLKLLLIIK